mgnify:CR=1 FL=1
MAILFVYIRINRELFMEARPFYYFLRPTFLCPERSPGFPREVPWSLWGGSLGPLKKNLGTSRGLLGSPRGYPGTSGGEETHRAVPASYHHLTLPPTYPG